MNHHHHPFHLHRKKVRSKKDVIDDVGHDDGNNKGICNAWYRQIVAVFLQTTAGTKSSKLEMKNNSNNNIVTTTTITRKGDAMFCISLILLVVLQTTTVTAEIENEEQ